MRGMLLFFVSLLRDYDPKILSPRKIGKIAASYITASTMRKNAANLTCHNFPFFFWTSNFLE